jgi:hypothetical protein
MLRVSGGQARRVVRTANPESRPVAREISRASPPYPFWAEKDPQFKWFGEQTARWRWFCSPSRPPRSSSKPSDRVRHSKQPAVGLPGRAVARAASFGSFLHLVGPPRQAAKCSASTLTVDNHWCVPNVPAPTSQRPVRHRFADAPSFASTGGSQPRQTRVGTSLSGRQVCRRRSGEAAI